MNELSLEQLHIDGTIKKEEALDNHIKSQVMVLQNLISSSFGPSGFDKLIINNVADVIHTNDGATILGSINVGDPFQKLVINLAKQQDKEAGDGTTTVVLLACELIKQGIDLKKVMHVNTVINGYKMAYRECVKFIKNRQKEPKKLGPKTMVNIAKTCLRSKIIGADLNFFAELVTQACAKSTVMTPEIYKLYGGSMTESEVYEGYGINCTSANKIPEPKKKEQMKFICLDIALQKKKMPLNVNINVSNIKEFENIKKKEEELLKSKLDKFIKAGVHVILSTRTIDEMCIKVFDNHNISVVKYCDKSDLEDLCKVFDITLVRTLSDFEGNDEIQLNMIGKTDHIKVLKLADNKSMLQIHTKSSSFIVLRGSNDYLLEEMERSVHDSICALRRTNESKAVIPSGGATETALFLYLNEFIGSICTKESYSIMKYADALLSLPRLLAENAGLDSDKVLATLLNKQSELRELKKQECYDFGLDISSDDLIVNNLENGVIEPAIVKLKALRAATEAAITVLRIDEFFKIDEKPKSKDECH